MTMSDIAIRVENLGKRYRIGARVEQAQNMRERIQNLALAPFDYLRRSLRGPTEEEILWALKDIFFEVKKGEVVGIIGQNGAGKSTLLKLLSRITEPTKGRAELYGRVSSLLEVGTGFHPELTGRENVYLNGTILGMTRSEVDRKFDEIVDFSGVEKFIDTPVKRYSSGMRVRLAFSVAAHLEPEILLIDEVLAVGDAGFQKKSLGKMENVSGEGRTVIFVSHNMGMIQTICDRVLLLKNGMVAQDGKPENVISFYLDSYINYEGKLSRLIEPDINKKFQILNVSLQDQVGKEKTQFDIAEPIILRIDYTIREKIAGVAVSFKVMKRGMTLFTSFDVDEFESLLNSRKPGFYQAEVLIPAMHLKPDRYTVDVGGGILNQQRLDYVEKAIAFDVEALSVGTSFKSFSARRDGLITMPVEWNIVG